MNKITLLIILAVSFILFSCEMKQELSIQEQLYLANIVNHPNRHLIDITFKLNKKVLKETRRCDFKLMEGFDVNIKVDFFFYYCRHQGKKKVSTLSLFIPNIATKKLLVDVGIIRSKYRLQIEGVS